MQKNSWTLLIFVFILIFSLNINADIKEKILKDIKKKNLFNISQKKYIGNFSPIGLQKEEKWVCEASNTPLEVYYLQNTVDVKVIMYICYIHSHYWIRVKGTILNLDLWYGPYNFEKNTLIKNTKKILDYFKYRRQKDIPMLFPVGIKKIEVYKCIKHNTLVKEFDLPNIENYKIKVYYCKEGEHYWVQLRNIYNNIIKWYGPYSIFVEERLRVILQIDKKVYQIGEPINIKIKVKNNSARGIYLKFNSGLQADYEIDGIYTYSSNHPSIMVITQKYIPPFRSTDLLVYTHTSNDYYLSPGEHYIKAIIPTSNYGKIESKVIKFKVKSFTNEQTIEKLMSKGIKYFEKGELEKAKKCFKKIILLEPTNYIAYYNLACIESINFNIYKALVYLEKSLMYGFDDYEQIINDPDLDNIRDEPKFKELIDKYFGF